MLLFLRFFYRNAGLFSIASATDIHGTEFDQRQNPIAVRGTLHSRITPAKYVDFVNYLDATQLSRFGLHNGCFFFFFLSCHFRSDSFFDFAGPPDGETLMASKWESLALAPACDPAFPDDYFLITVVRLSHSRYFSFPF